MAIFKDKKNFREEFSPEQCTKITFFPVFQLWLETKPKALLVARKPGILIGIIFKSHIFVFFGSYVIPNVVTPGGHFCRLCCCYFCSRKASLGLVMQRCCRITSYLFLSLLRIPCIDLFALWWCIYFSNYVYWSKCKS